METLLVVMECVISGLDLHLCGAYRKSTRRVLCLGLSTAAACIFALSGQCSFLCGFSFDNALGRGMIRVCIELLIPLVAWKLRSFNFDLYETSPNRGVRMLSCCLGCVLFLIVFQSTRPRGGRDLSIGREARRWTTHFNPLAPVGGETLLLMVVLRMLLHFNPLAPVGGETILYNVHKVSKS